MVISTRPKASALILLTALLGAGCSQEIRDFGAAGAGGAGGAGGSGGSGELVEDCLNGDDDDQDGKRDCDDEDCSPDFECVAPAPEGWIGPAALYKGPDAPACPAELPDAIYEGLADLVDEPAQCGACSCDPTGINVNCSLSQIESYSQADCTGSKNTTGQNNFLGGCVSKSVGNLPKSFRAQPPQANALGACMPSQAEGSLPPPTWASIARACSRTELGKGCGSNLCAPRGKPPFEATLCIVRQGDHECPAPYLTRQTFSDDANDVVDMRGCGPCQCKPPQGTCSVVTTLYSSLACGGMSVDLPNDSSCVPSGGFEVESLMPAIIKDASCDPMGGAPTGSITPGGSAVTTVCCMP